MAGTKPYIGVVLSIVFIVSTAIGQQPPKRHETPRDGERPRGQFSRDPFHEAVGEARRKNADAELTELMFNDKVRSHLEMTEEQIGQYRAIMRKPFDGIRDLRDQYKKAPETLDSLRSEIESLMSNSSDEAIKFLKETNKLDELVRVYVQLRSASAATSQQVALRIGLTGDELQAFREKKSEIWLRLMDKIGDEMEQLIRSRSEDRREQMGRLFRYAIQQQSEALEKRLSPQQRDKLKELAGEPIDGINTWFVKRPMPGPMGGPPSRRGEGAGRSSHRPGSPDKSPDNRKTP